MGADQAGDRGAPGAAIEQAKLKQRRASVGRETWDRLLDLAVETGSARWTGWRRHLYRSRVEEVGQGRHPRS
jgi:hypothetical protein